MKTADLITSFLSNEMTPDQERQFLLSVAASDSMRLSLKSHVMLDRIAANQLQRAEVPVAVREAIFAQMSASMAEVLPSNPPAERPMPRTGTGAQAGLLRRFGTQALVMVLTAGGFVAGYLTGSDQPSTVQAPQQQVQSAPAVTAEAPESPSVKSPVASAAPQSKGDRAVPSPQGNLAAEAGQEREPSRSNVRSTSGRPVASRTVRMKEPSRPAINLSNPLEPAGGVKSTPAANSTAAAGAMVAPDSLDNGATPTSVSVQPTIRKSSEANPASQDSKGD